MRDHRLQRIKAVIERHQRVTAKRDNHRLVLDREDSRLRHCWPRRNVGDRGPIAPLGDRLLIDPVPLRQRPQAFLTMLYRSTDCLSPRPSPVQAVVALP